MGGPEPGTRLGGRYEIRALLGEGGMGKVYLAYDEVLGTDVALKLVHHDVASQREIHKRLREEVLLAQKITHKNVCRTHDLEELEGSLLVKMEYITGETLAARHRRLRQLPIDDVLRIARAVAAGLEAAHAQQVVHCDLKPENIFIEHGSERVVLMDFGLARVEVRGSMGGHREISGTPAYMAPEQIKSTTIDARTDLYALGCVIYELVTDEVPYPRATTFDKAAEFFDAPVPDPRARRPDLPLWFARIIKRLLAKEPKQRFRSAMAVREALEGPHRLGGRHAALMALIMTLLVCAWGWYRAKHLPEWRPEVRPRQPAYEEMTNDPMISSDGQRLAYVSNRGDGQWRLYIEPMAGGQAQAILKGYHLYPLHWTQDGRALLGISGGFQVLRIAVPSGAVEEVAQKARDVDDCGGRIVVAASGIEPCPDCYRLIVLEGQGPARRQRELVRLSAGVQPEGLRCDRQGRQLTYYAVHVQMAKSQSDIYTMRLDESAPRRLTQDARTNRYPIFAPDGKSIVYSSQRSGSDELWEISVAGGEPIPLTTASGRLPVNYASRVTPTDISPDGKVLLYSEEFYALPLSAYSIDTQQRRRISQTLDFISQLCPMPDGREIIVRSERTDQRYAVAVSVEDGQERTLAPADVMALTPDGHELVYVIHDAQGAKIFAMPVTGGKARRISTLPEGVDHVAVDSAGWIHIRSGANEQHMRPLKVPLNGGTAVPEAAPSNSLVIPAPVGGWVMVGIPLGAQQYRWQLMAPGKSLMGPADRAFEGRHRVFWTADGASVLYWTGSEIRRHAIATGEERLLLRRELLDGSLALSPDGKTLYLAEWEGRSTRHMIVNFDKRPSLPH